MIMEEKILDILEDICGDDIMREDRDIDLLEEDMMDSIDYTELLIAIEEQLGIIIAPSEVKREDMNTPNKIIAAVLAKVK